MGVISEIFSDIKDMNEEINEMIKVVPEPLARMGTPGEVREYKKLAKELKSLTNETYFKTLTGLRFNKEGNRNQEELDRISARYNYVLSRIMELVKKYDK